MEKIWCCDWVKEFPTALDRALPKGNKGQVDLQTQERREFYITQREK